MRFSRARSKIIYSLLATVCTMLFFSGFAVAEVFNFSVQTSISGPLPGVNVYAFTDTGSYTGLIAATDPTGTAKFAKEDFVDGVYRFRI